MVMICLTQTFRSLNSEQYRKKKSAPSQPPNVKTSFVTKIVPQARIYLQRQFNIAVLYHYSCSIRKLLQNYYTLTLTAEVREEQEVNLKEPFTRSRLSLGFSLSPSDIK